MKTKFCVITPLIIFLVYGCANRDSRRVDIDGFLLRDEVQYETPSAVISVNKEDVLQTCRLEDNGEPNDFMYRQLTDYINTSDSTPVIITDTLGSIAGTTERDPESPYSHVTETFQSVMMQLAGDGKVRVINKASGDTANSIVVKKVDTKDHGNTELILPGDTVAFSMLRWIR